MPGQTQRMDREAAVAAVRSFLRREEQLFASRTAGRRALLRALLPDLVGILREAGATGIWVFGSLAASPGWSPAHPDSDLDLAATGLSLTALLSVERRVRALTVAPVDIVRMEDAASSLRERVLADGEKMP